MRRETVRNDMASHTYTMIYYAMPCIIQYNRITIEVSNQRIRMEKKTKKR